MERTRNNQVSFVAPRDRDELEGTLLLPTAKIVTDRSSMASTGNPVSAADVTQGALPTTHFTYTNQVLMEQPEDAICTVSVEEIPTAPVIPSYDSVDGRIRIQDRQACIAALRGRQMAEAEQEELRKAKLNVYSINYHVDRQIEEANRLAQERDAQGLEIQRDQWFGHEKSEEKPEATTATDELAFPISYKGGYEVAEYNMSEYSVDTEYATSEYKSIYD